MACLAGDVGSEFAFRDRVQQSSLVPEQPVDHRAWIDNAEATARVLAASAPLYRISAAAAFRIRVRTSPVALGAWYNNGRQDAVERVDDDIRRTRNDLNRRAASPRWHTCEKLTRSMTRPTGAKPKLWPCVHFPPNPSAVQSSSPIPLGPPAQARRSGSTAGSVGTEPTRGRGTNPGRASDGAGRLHPVRVHRR